MKAESNKNATQRIVVKTTLKGKNKLANKLFYQTSGMARNEKM